MMTRYKRARNLILGDKIVLFDNAVASVGLVVSARLSEDKKEKVQHMGTGNVARGIHVIYDDMAESLLHPDEMVEVVT